MSSTPSSSLDTLIQKYNLDISIVEKNSLFGSIRLDAECYRQEFLKIGKIQQIIILGENTKVADGDHSKFPEKQSQEMRYLRAKDIKGFFLENDDPIFVSKSYFNKQKRSHIFEENILISIMGSVGDITITPKGFETCIANRAICIIKEIKNIDPYYLFAFLTTKQADLLIERYKTGGVQTRINLEILNQLPIPLPSPVFQSSIAELVQEAHKQRELSKSLYCEAEQILLSELDLIDWQPSEENIAEKMSAEVELFGRCDAEFFQPKYDELFGKLKKFETKKLGKIVDYEKGVEPGADAYSESGVPFIRVADASIEGIDTIEKNISHELYDEYGERYSPKKDEILFTKDGTIGISFVVHEDMKVVLSGAFLRLQKKVEIESQYLALVLNSIVCKLQIERFSGGAIIAHLKPSDAMEMIIPILSSSIQSLISEKIIASHSARETSKKLLEKAKRAVEIFIEEDEESAEKYLGNI